MRAVDVLRRAYRTWRVVRNVGPDGRELLVEALAVTCVVRLALWTLPYAVALRAIDRVVAFIPERKRTPDRVAWAVASAGNRVPGATCLVRALVGKGLLLRSARPASLRFGVRRGAVGIEAHAWLELDGQALIGRDETFVPFEGVSS